MKIWEISVSVMSLAVILSCTNIYAQNANGLGMGRVQSFPTFASYDLDSNGVISETEFNKAQAERISQRTKAGGMMRNTKNAPTFKSIDTNNDGKISKEEFTTHQANFQNRRYSRNRR